MFHCFHNFNFYPLVNANIAPNSSLFGDKNRKKHYTMPTNNKKIRKPLSWNPIKCEGFIPLFAFKK